MKAGGVSKVNRSSWNVTEPQCYAVSWCVSLVQADSGCPGDATLRCHGDNAEVRLREAPAACSGCSNRGNDLQSVLLCSNPKSHLYPSIIDKRTATNDYFHDGWTWLFAWFTDSSFCLLNVRKLYKKLRAQDIFRCIVLFGHHWKTHI